MDVLICRNTLMYLNAETQARILARFHFALAEHGVLFLGKAEMLLSHPQLFEPIDLSRRLFRKITRVTPRSEILFGLSSLDIGRPFRDLDVSYRPVELRRSIELTLGERRTVRVSNVEFYRSATEKAYLEVEIHPLLDNDARALRPWASTS